MFCSSSGTSAFFTATFAFSPHKRADLSAICRSVNVLQPHDSVELHNLPLTVTVRCRKTPDEEIVNEIKGYGPREAASVPQTVTVPSQPTATNAAPPWARGR